MFTIILIPSIIIQQNPLQMLHEGHDQYPYSLLAMMYQSWESHKIPALYYHYLLSVMPNLQKKQQMLLMLREVKTLKASTHPYHKIVNSIQAREKSLGIVRSSIDILTDYESTDVLDWPAAQTPSTLEFNFQTTTKEKDSQPMCSYRVQHQDPRNPLLSPSVNGGWKQAKLQQLINHMKLYQRLTTQTILMISEWQKELQQLGYNQSIIQFLYNQEDYLLRIRVDTAPILDLHQHLFDNNLFLLLKKHHERSEFALLWREMKLSQDMEAKIRDCLEILASHEANVLKQRMLAKAGLTANRRKVIAKSTEVGKIYNNYNHGRDYIVVKDSQAMQAMKKTKIIHEPILYKNRKIMQPQFPKILEEQKLKSLKSSIVINPESRLLTIDRSARKHPVASNLLKLMRNHQSPEIYLKDTAYFTENRLLRVPPKYKKRVTEDLPIERSSSLVVGSLSTTHFSEKVAVVRIKKKYHLVLENRDKNNREDEIDRNMGLPGQRKLDMLHRVNSELKIKSKSLEEQRIQSIAVKEKQPGFHLLDPIHPEKQENVIGILEKQNEVELVIEENIKATEILKHLRKKVFGSSPEIPFEEIQGIAKKIIAHKKHVTFIRVNSGCVCVAWLAVNFVQKDAMMRRSIFIVYFRKFVKLSGFQAILLDKFVSHGYGVIRNQQKILYETQLPDVVLHPLLKIKYKIDPQVSQSGLKALMRTHENLQASRILKYHSYSKTSKYHKYCQHQQTQCQVAYNVVELVKITVNGNSYIRAKIQGIKELEENKSYRIRSAVSETELLIANSVEQIIAMEDQQKHQQGKGKQKQLQFQYIAIREAKFMKKYVNDEEKTVLSEFVTVNGTIPEVRSIAFTKQELANEVLFIEGAFFMAIMVQQNSQLKTLALVEFR